MIEKLRKKIIAINVISVCIVFLIAIIFIFCYGYSHLDAERTNRIFEALDYDFVSDSDFSDNILFYDLLLIEYDTKTGEIINYAMGVYADIDISVVEEKLAEIANSSQDAGLLTVTLRYVKKTEGDVCKIVVNNRYTLRSSLAPYLIYALGTVFLGIICYLCISWFLARTALRPVEETWIKQKQFIADASHELKTPISVILANMEIVSSHKDETVESQAKWIENTRSESKRMADLVAQLLFLAKNDDGAQVNMEETNASECVETIVLSYDAMFYENEKTFEYDIKPDIRLIGNDGQIKQLVTILLDNANKYSSGQGNIKLSFFTEGKKAVLTVENDSNELTDEQLSHLFDRFYTIEESRNHGNGGNGLGLSIAKAICSTHGGSIKAEYSHGKAVFTATLPRTVRRDAQKK